MKHAPLAAPPPPLSRPARAVSRAVRAHLPAVLWRALHPTTRQAFLDGPPPEPLPRIACATADGWDLPVTRLAPPPGGTGEPVVLLATLGATADIFRCGGRPTLAHALADAGFAVYLVGTRLDAAAVAAPAAPSPSFDDVVNLDVPALVDAVCVDAGYPRVHVVGHGFGGQAALGWVAASAGGRLASLAVISAPVRYPRSPGGATGRALDVAATLPGHWRLPTRRAARWGACGVEPDPGGDRRRAGLSYAAQDVPLAAVQQVVAWMRAGALGDGHGAREYGPALARVREPLWLAAGTGDAWCPAAWALALRDDWRGGPITLASLPDAFDHLDAVLHPDAAAAVHAPLVAWITRHRVRAWREGDATDVRTLAPSRPGGAAPGSFRTGRG